MRERLIALAAALVQAAGKQYASIAPYWNFSTPQGSLSLYDVAEASGISKADVQAAADKRTTRDGKPYYRVPTGIAGSTAGKAAGKAGKAAAFVTAAGIGTAVQGQAAPRLVPGKGKAGK